jgi:hypothetical protein
MILVKKVGSYVLLSKGSSVIPGKEEMRKCVERQEERE